MKKIINELKTYLDLNDDWDGYGGIAPSSRTINNVIYFITKLNKLNIPNLLQLKPSLGGSGVVGIYCETESKYIEICFDSNDIWYYGVDKQNNIEIYNELCFDKNTCLQKEIIDFLTNM